MSRKAINMFRGGQTVFFIMPSPSHGDLPDDCFFASDLDALRDDWCTVGKDLADAMIVLALPPENPRSQSKGVDADLKTCLLEWKALKAKPVEDCNSLGLLIYDHGASTKPHSRELTRLCDCLRDRHLHNADSSQRHTYAVDWLGQWTKDGSTPSKKWSNKELASAYSTLFKAVAAYFRKQSARPASGKKTETTGNVATPSRKPR